MHLIEKLKLCIFGPPILNCVLSSWSVIRGLQNIVVAPVKLNNVFDLLGMGVLYTKYRYSVSISKLFHFRVIGTLYIFRLRSPRSIIDYLAVLSSSWPSLYTFIFLNPIYYCHCKHNRVVSKSLVFCSHLIIHVMSWLLFFKTFSTCCFNAPKI